MLALAAFASYWVLPIFISGVTLQVIFNSAVFGIATSILITWGPATLYALRRGVTGENQSIVATFTLWLVVWLQRIYSITFVALDRPWWLMSSALPAFLAYLIGVTGILFLIAPIAVDDAQDRYRWRLVASLIFGFAFAASAYYLQLHGFDQ